PVALGVVHIAELRWEAGLERAQGEHVGDHLEGPLEEKRGKDDCGPGVHGVATAAASSAIAAPCTTAAIRTVSFTWASVTPPSVTVFSCARMQDSQPLMALTARHMSSKSIFDVAGRTSRFMRRRAGSSV